MIKELFNQKQFICSSPLFSTLYCPVQRLISSLLPTDKSFASLIATMLSQFNSLKPKPNSPLSFHSSLGFLVNLSPNGRFPLSLIAKDKYTQLTKLPSILVSFRRGNMELVFNCVEPDIERLIEALAEAFISACTSKRNRKRKMSLIRLLIGKMDVLFRGFSAEVLAKLSTTASGKMIVDALNGRTNDGTFNSIIESKLSRLLKRELRHETTTSEYIDFLSGQVNFSSVSQKKAEIRQFVLKHLGNVAVEDMFSLKCWNGRKDLSAFQKDMVQALKGKIFELKRLTKTSLVEYADRCVRKGHYDRLLLDKFIGNTKSEELSKKLKKRLCLICN